MENIEEYLTHKAFEKLQQNSLYNNWAKEVKSEKDDWQVIITNLQNSLTEDDILITEKDGYLFAYPFYFRRKYDGIDTELIYNPKTKLFHIETCECVVECCGKKLGWHKEENIDKIINEHYER